MNRLHTLLLAGAAAGALLPHAARAHGFAGDRFFPATIQTDDPFVADEGSLPSLTKNPTDPSGTQSYSVEADISKRITPDTDVLAAYQWNYFQPKGSAAHYGFGSLVTGQQYQLFVNAPHEAMALVGLNEIWGHTGAVNQGGADDHTTLEPAFDWGKGFGDLPDSVSWLQPLAITGNLFMDFPTKVNSAATLNQTVFNAGFAIEYSLEYLEHQVKDVGLRWPFDRLIPLVEVTSATALNRGTVPDASMAGAFTTNNLGHATVGVIAPGVIWSGSYFQVGAEAIIPYGEGQGHGIGGVVQLHFYYDDIFPHSFGRPIFGG
jgi:hypothetical protein